MSKKTKIALTVGCPKGIGPEIAARAISFFRNKYDISLFGELDALEIFKSRTKEDAGSYSFRNLVNAAESVLNGDNDALVTAPINKHYWKLAGINFTGHTDFLAEKCGTADYAMMFASPALKVVLVTIHEPLKSVSGLLTPKKIISASSLFNSALKKYFALSAPRIAVCGVNPHCGEDGLFGNEEQEIIKPAVIMLKEMGLNISGPHPADSIFSRGISGEFDGIVAMYHDQGLAPIKTLDYNRTVNLTIGLPIIRTSPDHGTAEDIAGTERADPGSLIAAIELAGQMAETGGRNK